jgi:hypothetical protein
VIVQVWAEAIRDPEMAAIVRELLGLLTDRIETLLAPRGSCFVVEVASGGLAELPNRAGDS